ncbi:MAG: hypothetical protein ACRD2A_06845 [Vicinamibacterales bacterium]
MNRILRVKFSRRRKLLYAGITVLGVVAAAMVAFTVADVYFHSRLKDQSGINVWGYRGEPLGRKQPSEQRMVMLGGSTVYGFGVRPDESVPAALERRLNSTGATGRSFKVANLGAPGQGAYSFSYDLSDYAYLNYDVALLYEGYNDLGLNDVAQRVVPNYYLWHRESPIFTLTGYYPILPLVLREKGRALVQGEDVNKADPPGQVVFRPGVAAQVAAGVLSAAATVSENLERQIGRLSETSLTPSVDEQCIPKWKQYCGAVRDAVSWALTHNKRVLFITQPYASDSHVEQQANVLAMLQSRFGEDSRLRAVNLGRAIDLRDRSLAFDGLHLNARGNGIIADHLLEPVLNMAR